MKHKIRIINRILIVVVLVCVLIIAIQGVLLSDKVSKDGGIDKGMEDSDYSILDKNEDVVDRTYDSDENMIEIETPYCILYYSAEFAEYLSIKDISDDSGLSKTFYCVIDGKETEIFTVEFGHSDRGYLLGYLSYGNNLVSVSISMSEIIEGEHSQDEFDLICLMQEHVNDIIESIVNDTNYIEQ